MSEKDSLSYQSAGVNIDAGNNLVERIKPHVKRTKIEGVLGGIGGFGGLFELPPGYKQPVLVSGTDGVGTKLKLAIDANKHNSIGIDLVAMCVNDIIVTGAKPLYFLDYYATGELNVDIGTDVVAGIAEGCVQSGCALIGGETAEMPGMYAGGDYDLAGFAVGIIDKDDIIDGRNVSEGDVLIGLNSSGIHSNGYSLVRKVLEVSNTSTNEKFGDGTLNDALLAPTRIYVKSLLKLIETGVVHSISHITGGGLYENLPRVLPDNLGAELDSNSWIRPEIFDFLQDAGNITDFEMYRTFNNGIGMVLVVPQAEAQSAMKLLEAEGEQAQIIGRITARGNEAVVIK